MLVTISGKFDASHFLTVETEYNEKCMSLHGHTYKYSFTVQGDYDERTGMVIDFGELKEKVAKDIKERFDHKNLNDFMRNPTAEAILLEIVEMVKNCIWYNHLDVKLYEVALNETEDCKVTWRKSCI